MKRALADLQQTAAAVPGYVAVHEVSSLGFITTGLDLEDLQ